MSHWRSRRTPEPYGQREASAALLGLVVLGSLVLVVLFGAAAVFVWPHAPALYMQ